ncbi:response regulator transcription factor [Pantoea dispersa]|uniref:response regulator transcription factor n=1 Tax=Pantoea dispersa TaxID=59814 RepID=UPI002DB7A7E1|nr:response regulator transcription factor [Pantoea dispersa]MEB5974912.1 response regulator transcription factor [Pantoea dispersa]
MSKIRLAILDDHPIICRSFDIICASEDDLTVAGKFGNSQELLKWLRINECDVLILDYILQNDEMDGLSLIKCLIARHPNLKILLSTSVDSLAVIRAAYMLGVRGYIAKREETPAYLSAIRSVANGQRYIPSHIAGALSQVPVRKFAQNLASDMGGGFSKESFSTKLLTSREAEVINHFLEGMGIVDIAAKLKLSRKTISGHKQSAMRKLGIGSDLELFKYRNDIFK